MPRRTRRSTLLFVLAVLAVLLVAALALARPGGGGSFSGGGGSGGGGSGGGGDVGAVLFLIHLCIDCPYVGVPLVLLIIAVAIIKAAVNRGRPQGWSTRDGVEEPGQTLPVAMVMKAAISRSQIDRLRSTDPDFSVILFEDFLYMLYAEVQRARGTKKLEELAAFVSPRAQAQLRSDDGLTDVNGIVIGGMRYLEAAGTDGKTAARLRVEFEANCTEVRGAGEQRLYVKDVLELSRAASARSRPPARVRRLDCPNCGAPLEAVRGGKCESCGEQVGGGRFDWTVESVVRVLCDERGPLLTSSVAEAGNNLPTIVDPGATSRLQLLQMRDRIFSWDRLRQRLEVIFRELQLGWSSRDWMRVRPFVSDNLFQSQLYWIDLYQRARARNVTDRARILRVELANVLTDKYYDAITVRLFATGLDYTISDDGKLMSGSTSRERAYTEYWTLIRGVEQAGQDRGDLNCPNCGAPLKINMAGSCEYCNAKVTSGAFDWVLSRIEQDESYAG